MRLRFNKGPPREVSSAGAQKKTGEKAGPSGVSRRFGVSIWGFSRLGFLCGFVPEGRSVTGYGLGGRKVSAGGIGSSPLDGGASHAASRLLSTRGMAMEKKRPVMQPG